MVFVIFKCSLRILVGITVFTAIHAGIIRPDIPAFDTVATLPHPLVLPVLEHNIVSPAKDIQRHSAVTMNAIPGKIPILPSGLYKDAIFPLNRTKPLRQHIHILRRQRDQLRHIAFQFFTWCPLGIHFHKTENTAVDIRR